MLHKMIVLPFQKLRWSLRSKIGLTFVLVLFCFILNGVISILLLLNIQTTQERQGQLSSQLEQVLRYELAYESEQNLFSDVIFVTKIQSSLRNNFRDVIINELVRYANRSTSVNPGFERDFSRAYFRSVERLDKLDRLIVAGDFETAKTEWRASNETFNQATKLIENQKLGLRAAQSDGQNEVRNTVTTSVIVIVSLTLFSIFLAIAMLHLIGLVMIAPLRRLQLALGKVAEGDLNQQLAIANGDEIGRLSRNFDGAVASLQQVLQGTKISDRLQEVTTQLATVSRQQAEGSAEQVGALTEVSVAMQQLNHTAGQIADSATRVVGLSGTTLEQIRAASDATLSGQERTQLMVDVVERVLVGVERVRAQVDNFRQSTEEVYRQTASAHRVVSLLSEIAKEVNIVALNAAIEATGAGVYGERFKMVARQVRSLAHRANEATEEARTLIANVQYSSQNALTQVAEGQVEIAEVADANSGLHGYLDALKLSAERVSQAVANLVNLAEQVNNQAVEIQQATHQQHKAHEQVISSTRSADAIAHNAAEASAELAHSSLELEQLANRLSGVLRQVKLAV
jgi:methyl-accepting chemotaxis protein